MSDMEKSSPRLLKSTAYSVIAISSLTAFGHASRGYVSGFPTSAQVAALIAFGLLSFILSTALLVLWLLKEDLAQKACAPAAHVTLVTVAVALGAGAVAENSLVNISLYTALVVSLVLCVRHWNNNNSLKLPTTTTTTTTTAAGSGGNGNSSTYVSQVSPTVVTAPVV